LSERDLADRGQEEEQARLPVPGTDGRLKLRLGVRHGKTVLLQGSWRCPLQVMKPLELADGSLMVSLLHPAGGILQGDALGIQIAVEEGARVLITTPSVAKAYRMETGEAVQEIRASLARDAALEFLPEMTLLFAGSRLTQKTSIAMEEGAHLLWWEIVATGRRARGEALAFESFHSSFEVRQGATLLALERMHLEPGKREYRLPTLLADYSHWGSLWIFTTGNHLERAEEQARAQVFHHPRVHAGISRLHRGGLLLRALGSSNQQILELFQQVRTKVCPEILGSPAAELRKY